MPHLGDDLPAAIRNTPVSWRQFGTAVPTPWPQRIAVLNHGSQTRGCVSFRRLGIFKSELAIERLVGIAETHESAMP